MENNNFEVLENLEIEGIEVESDGNMGKLILGGIIAGSAILGVIAYKYVGQPLYKKSKELISKKLSKSAPEMDQEIQAEIRDVTDEEEI